MFRSLRISHVEFRFPGSEKLGPGRNGRMERKISRISEFPEKRDNLERLTKIFEKIFRKFSVPFDFEPEFSEILVEWNAPLYFSTPQRTWKTLPEGLMTSVKETLEYFVSPQQSQGQCIHKMIILLRNDFLRLLACLLYTSPSPRDLSTSRMPSSA